MQKFKFTIIFAAFGFILSLTCGLLSRFSFVRIILQAFICAIVFAILSFLIKFLYDKFLSDEVTENQGDLSSGSDGLNESSTAQTGSVVDFTVGEDDLPNSNNENHYYVGDNHQMLTETDISGSSDFSDNKDFVPLRNKETIDNISETEAVKPSDVFSRNDSSNEQSGDLDVLPDLSDMETSNEPRGESNDDPVEFENNSINSKKKGVGDVDMKDTELIAKAISSVLSDEEAS